jgi:hypothetical protein
MKQQILITQVPTIFILFQVLRDGDKLIDTIPCQTNQIHQKENICATTLTSTSSVNQAGKSNVGSNNKKHPHQVKRFLNP